MKNEMGSLRKRLHEDYQSETFEGPGGALS